MSDHESVAFFATAPYAMAVVDHDFRVRRANDAFATLAQVTVVDAVERTVRELLPDLATGLDPLLRRARDRGERADADLSLSGPTRARQQSFASVAFPLPDDGDPLIGLIVRDTTGAAEEQTFVAALHEISESIGATTTMTELEERIVRGAAIVPATVAVVLTVVDPETDRVRLVRLDGDVFERREADPDADAPLLEPYRSRDWHDESRATLVDTDAGHDWLHDDATSVVTGPLVNDGEIRGTLTWQLSVDTATDQAALALMRSFAGTARISLANIERQELDRRLAVSYQRSLLPGQLPEVDDLEVAGDYRSAMEPDRSGGDWYDVVERRDGAIVLVTGDAVGHGIRATIGMGHVRDIARSAALERTTPAEILRQVDLHVSELGEGTMAAIAMAVVAPGACLATVASAANPPAVHRRPDGGVELLEPAPGPFVGSGLDANYADLEVELEPGATIVLFSDGLVEDADGSLDEVLAEIAAAVASTDGAPETVCEALVARAESSRGRDDVVILAARRRD